MANIPHIDCFILQIRNYFVQAAKIKENGLIFGPIIQDYENVPLIYHIPRTFLCKKILISTT